MYSYLPQLTEYQTVNADKVQSYVNENIENIDIQYIEKNIKNCLPPIRFDKSENFKYSLS